MFQHCKVLTILIVPLASTLVAGCTQPNQRCRTSGLNSDQVQALRKLAPFVGKWEMAGEIRRRGLEQPQILHGFNEAGWDQNGVFLVGRGSARVDDQPVNHGMAAWTYDPVARLYRFVLLDSSGSAGTGVAEFDESACALQARLTMEGPAGQLRLIAAIRFLDANTKQEHWTAFDGDGQKLFEIQKTERRRM